MLHRNYGRSDDRAAIRIAAVLLTTTLAAGGFAEAGVGGGETSGEPDRTKDLKRPPAESPQREADRSESNPNVGIAGALVSVYKTFAGDVIDGYNLYLPRSYDDGSEAFPLIVYLTGGCGVGGPIEDLSCWGLPREIHDRIDDDGGDDDGDTRLDRLLLDTFVVVSPHMTGGTFQERQFYDQHEAIRQILDEIIREVRIDESRVYLTGAGRGGHGVWGIASRMPQRFAAIAPIRGYTTGVIDFDAVAELPLWVGHNRDDDQVEFEHATAAIEAVEATGGDKFLRLESLDASERDLRTPRIFTSVPCGGWPNLFERAEFYDWLLQFRRRERSL